MSEDVSQSRREPGRFSRAVIILIGVSLLVPHTLMFTWSISRVVNTATFVLVAVCWIILRHDILTVVDTNSTTLLQFPYGGALFSSIILFPIHLAVIRTQSRFIKGITSKNSTIIVIVIALSIQVFLTGCSWLFYGTSFNGAYPFPIFHLLNFVSVFWERQPKLD